MLERRLIKIVLEDRSALAAFFITALCSVLAGILIVLQAQNLSQIIQRAFLTHQPLPVLVPLFRMLLAIISFRALITFIKEYGATQTAQRVKDRLRNRLLLHITKLGPIALRNKPGGTHTGEVINTAMEGIEALEAYYRDYLPQVFTAVAVPLTILIVVIPIDWITGLVLFFTAPLIPLFMVLIGNLSRTVSHRQWQALSRMSAHFFDVLQGLTTLKVFNQARPQTKIIAEIGEDHRRLTMGVLRVAFLSAFSLEFLATLSTAVVAVGIGLRLLYGHLEFEKALCVLFLTPDFYLPLRMLGARFHAATSGVSAAEQIFALLDTPAPKSVEHPPAEVHETVSSRPQEMVIENVAFSYSTEEMGGLQDISFCWPIDEKIALVGPSGAGKSTLIHLLLRFVEPTKGRILIDGIDMNRIEPLVWLRKIAWVSQNPHLFNASVEENIRLTNPEATYEDVERAARQAHIADFIRNLPHGYRTPIGERGLTLSAGQAQRIALARALLKDDPWLLILDEATANLDPHMQTLTGEALDLASENRFSLTVAHRLSSAARADKIIVLNEGFLVQEGNHDSLSRQIGLYHDMIVTDRDETQSPANLESSPDVMVTPPRNSQQEPGFDTRLQENDQFNNKMDRSGLIKGLLLSFVMGLAAILSNVGLMGASAYIISAAALHPSVADIQVAIVSVRFFGVVRAVFRYFERYVSHNVTLQILARLRVWFFRALEPLAPARLSYFHRADLLTRIVNDINSLEVFYVRIFYPPIVALATALVISLLLRQLDPGLGLSLIFFMALGGIVTPAVLYLLGRKPAAEIVRQRSELNTAISDHVQGLAELLAAGAAERHLTITRDIHRQMQSSQQKMGCLNGIQDGLSVFLTNLSAFALLWIAIPFVETGRMNGIYLAVIVTVALAAFEAVQPLPPAAQYLRGNIASFARLRDIVDTPAEVNDPTVPASPPLRHDLEIKGLSFTYPDRLEPALDDVGLSIPPGRRIALVGESGSGKSTLLNLMLRFWEYKRGEIRLGGSEIHSLSQAEIRNRLAVLNQPVELFNASIRENLLLANPHAADDEIVAACQTAEIHQFIMNQPEGYDTVIGERGARLSAGERQRIALARTFLRQSPIIILDEPTANLDVITEQRILDNLLVSLKGRTLLLITHRLIRMERMDEILVMRAGKIVEHGTHRSLIAGDGIYSRQVRDQNDWFINDTLP